MSQNSILIVFVSSTFAGNIRRIKGCILQTLSTRSLYLAFIITHFLSCVTGLIVFFYRASVYNPVRKLQIYNEAGSSSVLVSADGFPCAVVY